MLRLRQQGFLASHGPTLLSTSQLQFGVPAMHKWAKLENIHTSNLGDQIWEIKTSNVFITMLLLLLLKFHSEVTSLFLRSSSCSSFAKSKMAS